MMRIQETSEWMARRRRLLGDGYGFFLKAFSSFRVGLALLVLVLLLL
jgi:hypothetical protein